jgi:hypothetical protein
VSDANFRQASLVQGALPVTPGAESLRVTNREVRMAQNSRTEDTRFFSRRQPAAVERVPFEQQRQGMEQIVRRNFADRGAETAASPGGAGAPGEGNMPRGTAARSGFDRAGQTDRGAPQAGSSALPRTESGTLQRDSGWRRIGEPTASGVQASGDRDRRDSGQGWRRIGEPAAGAPSAAAAREQGDSGRSSRTFGERQATQTGGMSRVDPQQGRGGSARAESPALPQPEGGMDRSRSGEGWRRFGTSRPQSEAPDVREPAGGRLNRSETNQPGRDSADSWNRRGGGQSRSEPPRVERQQTPRFERRDSSRDRVYINPPIVRERSTGRSESTGGRSGANEFRRGGGGESRSGGAVRGGSSGMSRGGGQGRGGGSSSGASRGGGGGRSRSR